MPQACARSRPWRGWQGCRWLSLGLGSCRGGAAVHGVLACLVTACARLVLRRSQSALAGQGECDMHWPAGPRRRRWLCSFSSYKLPNSGMRCTLASRATLGRVSRGLLTLLGRTRGWLRSLAPALGKCARTPHDMVGCLWDASGGWLSGLRMLKANGCHPPEHGCSNGVQHI